MLTSEATALLERIARAMRPAQPPWNHDDGVLTEWAASIVHRDATAAHVNTVMRQWHDDGNQRWPNLYTFSDRLQHVTRQRPTNPENTKCHQCNGHGWRIADDTIERHGHPYTYATPCPCPAGRNAEQSALWKDLANAEQ